MHDDAFQPSKTEKVSPSFWQETRNIHQQLFSSRLPNRWLQEFADYQKNKNRNTHNRWIICPEKEKTNKTKQRGKSIQQC